MHQTSLAELRADSTGRDGHHDRLHSAYFLIAHPLFFGHAKVMLHSGITTTGHRRSQVNHERRFWLQYFIVTR